MFGHVKNVYPEEAVHMSEEQNQTKESFLVNCVHVYNTTGRPFRMPSSSTLFVIASVDYGHKHDRLGS